MKKLLTLSLIFIMTGTMTGCKDDKAPAPAETVSEEREVNGDIIHDKEELTGKITKSLESLHHLERMYTLMAQAVQSNELSSAEKKELQEHYSAVDTYLENEEEHFYVDDENHLSQYGLDKLTGSNLERLNAFKSASVDFNTQFFQLVEEKNYQATVPVISSHIKETQNFLTFIQSFE